MVPIRVHAISSGKEDGCDGVGWGNYGMNIDWKDKEDG